VTFVSEELAGGIPDVPVFDASTATREEAVIAEEQQTACPLLLVLNLESRPFNPFVPDKDSRLIRAGCEEFFFCSLVVGEPAHIIDRGFM